MDSFDRELLIFIDEQLEQPRCASARMRIQHEIRNLMTEMPNARLTVRSARIEVVACTDFFNLIIQVRLNGSLLGKSEVSLSMTKSMLLEDYLVTWIVQ